MSKLEEFGTELVTTFLEATNSCDHSKVSKLINEDAVFCLFGEAIKGLKQNENHHEDVWNAIKNLKFWAADIETIHHDGKCRIYTYQAHYSGYEEGNFIEGSARTTDVFVENDITKQWELLHTHSSAIN